MLLAQQTDMEGRMGKLLKIRKLTLGDGNPRICATLTGKTPEDIWTAAKAAKAAGVHLAEWRADGYEGVEDIMKTKAVAALLREVLGEKPILFTYRTEDGMHEITKADYIRLNRKIAESRLVDLIDVEYLMGDQVCRELIACAYECGVKVIVSNYDVTGTPDREELKALLQRMRAVGADIPKVAVTPQNPLDVLELLGATYEFLQAQEDCPVITMSMKWLGCLSRISGMFFGSAVTFVDTGRTLAPGQLSVKEVKQMFKILKNPNQQDILN